MSDHRSSFGNDRPDEDDLDQAIDNDPQSGTGVGGLGDDDGDDGEVDGDDQDGLALDGELSGAIDDENGTRDGLDDGTTGSNGE